MKKQVKITIILAILVVLSVGALIVASLVANSQKKKEEKAEKDLELIQYDENTITEIDITSSDGEEYNLKLKDGTWDLTNRDDIILNSAYGNSIADKTFNLKAVKNIGKSDDLSSFGLEKPAKAVITAGGKKYTLLVGNPSSTNKYFYAMVDGRDDIYTIDYNTGALFYLSRDSMKNSFITMGWSSSDFSYFKLERKSKTVYEIKKDKKGWEIVKPIESDANSAGVGNLLANLSGLEIDSFGDEGLSKEEIAEHGFDDPYYKVSFKNNEGKKMTLEVADKIDPSSDSTCEVYYKEINQIANISESYISFLESSAASFMSKTISNLQISEIKEINVDLDDSYDADFDLKYDYNSESYDYNSIELNGKKVDVDETSAVNALVQSVTNISFEDIDADASPSGQPAETITITTTDGKTIKYEYIQTDSDNKFYCMKDGKYTGLIVRRKAFSGEGAVVDCYKDLKDIVK